MTTMLMIYDRKRTAYRAAKCPRQSITYSPPTVGHRHQKSQQMQEQNAASPAYYMCSHPQSHKMTTNWEFLGISWDSLRLLEIPRNTMDLTLSQPTKDVFFRTYTRPVF